MTGAGPFDCRPGVLKYPLADGDRRTRLIDGPNVVKIV